MSHRRSVQPDAQAAPLFDVLPTYARPTRAAPGPAPELSTLLLLDTYEQREPTVRPDAQPAAPVASWDGMTRRQFGHAQTALQSVLFAAEQDGQDETAALF